MKSLDAKYIKMTQTPIPNLVVNLAVPSIISMVITAVYNMADTYFVRDKYKCIRGSGNFVSLMALVQAIGFTMGMGSGNYIAQL